jgi:DNA-binding response OmpR family regulator
LLLIENHDDLAEATAALLRRAGFEVQVVQTGQQAIKTAAVFLLEVVLCDMNLPDISGFDVAKELRTHPDTERVLFGVHSAMRVSDIGLSERQLHAMNVDMFLTKPLTAEKIAAVCRRLKEQCRGRGGEEEAG